MALRALDIRLLVNILNDLNDSHKSIRVLSLGHPDILATPSEIAPFLNGYMLPLDNNRVRQERIGMTPDNCVGSSISFFEHFDASLTIIDRRNVNGLSLSLDLNEEFANRRYNLIIDPGTIEHVFNIGNVFRGIIQTMDIDGYVYHVNPMNMYNHGYWNLSPITYYDFYTSNGFEIVNLFGRNRDETLVALPSNDPRSSAYGFRVFGIFRKIKILRPLCQNRQRIIFLLFASMSLRFLESYLVLYLF